MKLRTAIIALLILGALGAMVVHDYQFYNAAWPNIGEQVSDYGD
jgi:hypothetical protein